MPERIGAAGAHGLVVDCCCVVCVVVGEPPIGSIVGFLAWWFRVSGCGDACGLAARPASVRFMAISNENARRCRAPGANLFVSFRQLEDLTWSDKNVWSRTPLFFVIPLLAV